MDRQEHRSECLRGRLDLQVTPAPVGRLASKGRPRRVASPLIAPRCVTFVKYAAPQSSERRAALLAARQAPIQVDALDVGQPAQANAASYLWQAARAWRRTFLALLPQRYPVPPQTMMRAQQTQVFVCIQRGRSPIAVSWARHLRSLVEITG
jgi:hypothetical protein